MEKFTSNARSLNQVLNAVASGVTVQDPKGNLIYVNETAARMMNCPSPEEAVQKGGLAILSSFSFYDEQGERINIGDLPGRKALKGIPEPEMVVGYKASPKSETKWTTIKAMPVVDGKGAVIFAVNVMQDITELKNTERQLKDANDRITKLLEQTLAVDAMRF